MELKLREATQPKAARRKRRSSEEIIDRLLQAAEQEFKKSGYAGATTAAIARAADVTETQLFRCFGSKAELFRESIFCPLDRHFSDFHARNLTLASGSRSLREMARLYITELQQFAAEHRELLVSLVVAQTYAEGPVEINSLRTYFDRGAAMLSRTANQTPALDARLIVRVSTAAVLANVMFKDWLFPKGLATDAEIEESIIDFVIKGLSENLRAEA